jgi:ferrous iron transport protein B
MNSEIKEKKWLFAGVGIQLAVGYTVGFLVFFFGTLFTGADMPAAWMSILGWSIVILTAAIFTAVIIKKNGEVRRAREAKEKVKVVT